MSKNPSNTASRLEPNRHLRTDLCPNAESIPGLASRRHHELSMIEMAWAFLRGCTSVVCLQLLEGVVVHHVLFLGFEDEIADLGEAVVALAALSHDAERNCPFRESPVVREKTHTSQIRLHDVARSARLHTPPPPYSPIRPDLGRHAGLLLKLRVTERGRAAEDAARIVAGEAVGAVDGSSKGDAICRGGCLGKSVERAILALDEGCRHVRR